MRYVKAVGFHSWGGGTPEQYKAWGDLAEWLNLPLLVTELGVDASAYMGGMYDSFSYGMREVRMYQELFLYARPKARSNGNSPETIPSSARSAKTTGLPDLIAHLPFLVRETLHGPDAAQFGRAGDSSDNDKVLLTAFAQGPERRVYTLHVANMAARAKSRSRACRTWSSAPFARARTRTTRNAGRASTGRQTADRDSGAVAVDADDHAAIAQRAMRTTIEREVGKLGLPFWSFAFDQRLAHGS